MLKEKIDELWADKRRLKERVLPAVLAAASVVSTLFFFGVLDLYFSNAHIFPFYFQDIAWMCILGAVIVFVAVAGATLLLRGKLFDFAICLELGIVLASHIQASFLNIDFGQLTGASIAWPKYSIYATLNLVVWAVLVFLPFIVYYFSKGTWKKLSVILPILICGLQLSSLAYSIYSNFEQVTSTRVSAYITDEGWHELSNDKNIVVFIVDYLDKDDIDELISSDSPYIEDLRGFTYFDDYISQYNATFPAITFMFTGAYYDPVESPEVYFERAWGDAEKTFFRSMTEHGYKNHLYLTPPSSYIDPSVFGQAVENICYLSNASVEISYRIIARGLVRFAAYRLAPHALKASYWMHTEYFDNAVFEIEASNKLQRDDFLFYDILKENGIALRDDSNVFTVIYLRGPHPPHMMTEEVKRVEFGESDRPRATRGSFKIITEYLSYMKQAGIYDTAAIIITADHGIAHKLHNYTGEFPVVPFFIKLPNQTDQPLVTLHNKASHANLRATILYAAGIKTTAYGLSVWEEPDDEGVLRRFTDDKSNYVISGSSHYPDNFIPIKSDEDELWMKAK